MQSPSLPAGARASPTVDASEAYELAGIGPRDVDVAQLQDTNAGSEIIHMAENGLRADGEQEADRRGDTEITGRMPVNTDGGLIANGEPIGASGLRQVHELVLQLRRVAGARQVPGPRVGYAHLYGARRVRGHDPVEPRSRSGGEHADGRAWRSLLPARDRYSMPRAQLDKAEVQAVSSASCPMLTSVLLSAERQGRDVASGRGTSATCTTSRGGSPPSPAVDIRAFR